LLGLLIGLAMGSRTTLLDSPAGAVRESVPMEQSLSGKLAGIVLPDSEGQEIRLGSLWADSPAVLVFLRHYG